MLFDCVLNKNWTQMLYSEINKSESEVKFPINSDYILSLCEWSEKVVIALQRFVLRASINI